MRVASPHLRTRFSTARRRERNTLYVPWMRAFANIRSRKVRRAPDDVRSAENRYLALMQLLLRPILGVVVSDRREPGALLHGLGIPFGMNGGSLGASSSCRRNKARR